MRDLQVGRKPATFTGPSLIHTWAGGPTRRLRKGNNHTVVNRKLTVCRVISLLWVLRLVPSLSCEEIRTRTFGVFLFPFVTRACQVVDWRTHGLRVACRLPHYM